MMEGFEVLSIANIREKIKAITIPVSVPDDLENLIEGYLKNPYLISAAVLVVFEIEKLQPVIFPNPEIEKDNKLFLNDLIGCSELVIRQISAAKQPSASQAYYMLKEKVRQPLLKQMLLNNIVPTALEANKELSYNA